LLDAAAGYPHALAFSQPFVMMSGFGESGAEPLTTMASWFRFLVVTSFQPGDEQYSAFASATALRFSLLHYCAEIADRRKPNG
jgi:hypothetical protein